MRKINITDRQGALLAVLAETADPNTWTLCGAGLGSRRLIAAAKSLALQNGAERILFPGMPADGSNLPLKPGWDRTEETPEGLALLLISPGKDRMVHDDYDRRTPVSRITCPTCLERIAEGRIADRARAISQRASHLAKSAAQHSRRIAEAYRRLADIEDAIADRWEEENPGSRSPQDPGVTAGDDGLYRMRPRLPGPVTIHPLRESDEGGIYPEFLYI